MLFDKYISLHTKSIPFQGLINHINCLDIVLKFLYNNEKSIKIGNKLESFITGLAIAAYVLPSNHINSRCISAT